MKANQSAAVALIVIAAGSCASSGTAKPSGSQVGGSAAKSARPPPVTAVCGQFPASLEDTSIDLAPPAGFTEICARDQDLCRELTSGYPPGVTTIGYFVPAEKWAARERGEHPILTRYLIAQATSTSEVAFPVLKSFLHERAGRIQDHSDVAGVLEHMERIDLGVLDEGPDFISMGVIIKARLSASGDSPGPQVAINTAFLDRGHVLSLYTHCAFAGPRDEEDCRRLTTEWLVCLRGAAHHGGGSG